MLSSKEIIRQPSLRSRLTWFIFFAILEIGFNAAAGAAAAATGAHVNSQSNSKTAHDSIYLVKALGLGALGGVLKSGMVALVNFGLSFGGLSLGMWLILALIATPFGICVVLTSAISSLALGEVPGGLLIAAVVTAIPFSVELVGFQIQPKLDIYGITLVGWDALSGFVFAAMAHKKGFDICSYNAGAAAGAVYGTLTFVNSLLIKYAKGPNETDVSVEGGVATTTVTNNFGSYAVREGPGGLL